MESKIPKRKRLSVDYTLDIETEAWDKPVVAGLLDVAADEFTHAWWESEADFAEMVLGLEGTLWAHNGGRFDALWLCEWIRRLGLKAEVYATGARITLVKVGKLEIRDSMALIPLRLADAAKIAGREKAETQLPCVCPDAVKARRKRIGLKEDCGGYCSIRRIGMSVPDRRKLVEYLEVDCRVDAEALLALQDYADVKDLDLCGTIGASAWATIKRRYGVGSAQWSWSEYNLARRGYYGGRVQVFRPVAVEGYQYDMNSAYPDALSRLALPVGRPDMMAGQEARAAFEGGKPGIFTARVDVPGMFIPPLPYRDEHDRVQYPVGKVRGTWCAPELRAAVELGCRVDGFGASLVWPEEEKVLAPFAEWAWGLRAAAGKKSAIGKWLKFFLNSPTGKLAQKPETQRAWISHENPDVCPADGDCREGRKCGRDSVGCCEHRCLGSCGVARPLGRFDSAVWTKEIRRIPDNGFVQWAAYLTGGTRVKLGRQLRDDGQDGRTACYTDTDGIKTLTLRTEEIGDADTLGAWLFEGKFVPSSDGEPGFRALAPKTYRTHGEDGAIEVKSKGISEPDWPSLVKKEPCLVDRGVEQFRTAARLPNFFTRKRLERTLKYDGVTFGDRRLAEDGLTYPPRFD